MAHIILLLLIAAENTDFLNISIEETPQYGIAETSCSSCYQKDLVFED